MLPNGGEKDLKVFLDKVSVGEKDKKGNASMLDVGLSSTVFGVIGMSIMANPLIPLGIGVAGLSMTIYDIMERSGFLRDKEKEFWETLFVNVGLITKDEKIPLLQETRPTDYGVLYRFNCPTGLGLSDFKKERDVIECALGSDVQIKYSNKNILIEVYTNKLKDEYPFNVISSKKMLEVVLGYTYGEKPVTINMVDNSKPHWLIAGATGAGKSTTLRVIITNLVLCEWSHLVNLSLVDLKFGMEFGIFEDCKNVKALATSIPQAEVILSDAIELIEKRGALIKKERCGDIHGYNKKHKKNPMTFEFIIIDEFAEFYNDKKSNSSKNCITKIGRLGGLARACGVHLILATQRPDKDIIDGKIKANIENVIGLSVKDEVNSRIIGIEGLERLYKDGIGVGLIKANNDLVKTKIMNLSHLECTKIMDKINGINEKEREKRDEVIRRQVEGIAENTTSRQLSKEEYEAIRESWKRKEDERREAKKGVEQKEKKEQQEQDVDTLLSKIRGGN